MELKIEIDEKELKELIKTKLRGRVNNFLRMPDYFFPSVDVDIKKMLLKVGQELIKEMDINKKLKHWYNRNAREALRWAVFDAIRHCLTGDKKRNITIDERLREIVKEELNKRK